MVPARRVILATGPRISIASVKRLAVACCLVAVATPVSRLGAQEEAPDRDTNVAQHVSDLIVHVEAFKPRREDGAGVVVGVDDDWVYIATARHVVTLTRDPSIMADSVRVEFESERRFVTATIDTVAASRNLDLAVIRVPLDAAVGAGFRPVLDRLGDSDLLGPGSQVSPVGCPGSNCWRAPSPADRVLSANPVDILFQTTFVRGGSSGGGIFNEWDEVVGMVHTVEPPGAYAYPMDFVVNTIEEWGRPVTIQRPSIPRRGYLTTVGFTVMRPTSGKPFPDGRMPSARLSLAVELRGPIDLHVGFLRLAPEHVRGVAIETCPGKAPAGASLSVALALRDRRPCEVVVNAGMIGLGARIQSGRVSARPFAEFGMGRSQGRYDVGGVYEIVETVDSEDDDLRYLPNFDAVGHNRMGGGAGLTLDYVVFPHLIVQGIAGYWRFQDAFEDAQLPAGYEPVMPSVYVGFGVRWGM